MSQTNAHPCKKVLCTSPFEPAASKRYEPYIEVLGARTSHSVPPGKVLTIASVDDTRTPSRSGWSAFVHPGGQLYFALQVGIIRFLTESYLYDDNLLDEVNEFQRYMLTRLQREYDSSTELDVVLCMSSQLWTYYMADKGQESLLWLDECEITSSMDSLRPAIQSQSHLKYYLDAQYWYHVQQFPHHVQILPQTLERISSVLTHSAIGLLSGVEPMCPFDTSKTQQLLGLIDQIKARYHCDQVVSDADGQAYLTESVAMLLSTYANHRFMNFHGQRQTRLLRSQRVTTIDGDTHRTSWIVKMIYVATLFAPLEHRRSLEVIAKNWVSYEDEIPMFQAVVSSWQQIVIIATVFLNANIAFLAVPGVSDADTSHMSLSQVCANISIVTSLGSTISGTILLKQNPTNHSYKPGALAIRYRAEWIDAETALDITAIIYSIPYALLLWSLLAFVVGVASLSFRVRDTASVILFALFWFCVFALTVYAVSVRMVLNARSNIVDYVLSFLH